MNKEEFNWFWKDTTKEDVLNQFYYEHLQLREEIERINKVIDYIESNPLVMIGDYDYFVNDILQMEEYCSRMSFIRTLLKILKGEEKESE